MPWNGTVSWSRRILYIAAISTAAFDGCLAVQIQVENINVSLKTFDHLGEGGGNSSSQSAA